MAEIECACGEVCLQVTAPAIMTVICHCTSCRTAGRDLDARSPVAPIVDVAGGTPVVPWRKDRVRCVRGNERLTSNRLTPESPSRRMVASSSGLTIFLARSTFPLAEPSRHGADDMAL
jgi:hypothetical protein